MLFAGTWPELASELVLLKVPERNFRQKPELPVRFASRPKSSASCSAPSSGDGSVTFCFEVCYLPELGRNLLGSSPELPVCFDRNFRLRFWSGRQRSDDRWSQAGRNFRPLTGTSGEVAGAVTVQREGAYLRHPSSSSHSLSNFSLSSINA